ncbi:MAG: ABC transporter ATP-binding protein [Thermofilum sp.]|uniref:ABC transporter ATP-binding protein n=1 Tax=Thermofilum pendens TaxID=2269 RepID=A0A7C4D301_THEPE
MSVHSLLELRNVTKIFSTGVLFFRQRIVAVDDVSFRIPGERPVVFTLAGESGSGKTTIARLILGFLKPDKGDIVYRGRNLTAFSSKDWNWYRREVQAVFQDPYAAYNPIYTVDRVLFTPLKKYRLTFSDSEASEMVAKALESVGLRPEEILGRYPYELSGGQRQRVLLARSLLLKPRLIIADEPVSMLDASLRAEVLNLMLDLKNKVGVSFLYITHDLSTASYISDFLAIMYRGVLVETGPIDEVIEEPLHPYTKLLLDSIPVPDPNKRWTSRVVLPPREYTEEKRMGCKFYDRCLLRMNICKDNVPPPKIINSRVVRCFLY